MTAPKTRPLISGETTLAELAAVMASHRLTGVDIGIIGLAKRPSQFFVEIEAANAKAPTLWDALNAALRMHRQDEAEWYGLTDEEAAS